MIKIKTNDIELLKDACESLAYALAQYENPTQYDWSDKQIGSFLECEGLEIEYS